MKRSFTLWAILLTLLSTAAVSAQTNCEYLLIMYDELGNGWEGSFLNITVDGNTNSYSLDNINDNGLLGFVGLPVVDQAPIELQFSGVNFSEEISYILLNLEGDTIYQDGLIFTGTAPLEGVVFSGTVACPSCPPPLAFSVSVDKIRAFTADLSWVPSDPEGDYYIEYDTLGFTPGTGKIKQVQGATATLFNLEEKTEYSFYLQAVCTNGDTSNQIGPYNFETLYANDVGVTSIFSPLTGCDLDIQETIMLAITNFGGAPQSLIPFNFSLNGIPGAVGMPQDGFYTGVIGTDSTELAEFDRRIDLSFPDEYLLEVWTELEGDSIPGNDTLAVSIVNIPLVQEYPYAEGFERWGGGWLAEQNGNGSPSWERGLPDNVIISSAGSGANAWVTNLSGPYNSNEVSYLVSPCLDFSGLSEDPMVGFQLNVNTESCCDETWLEVSRNDGETWQKVGVGSTGLNWYNDLTTNWWEGDGGFEGWAYAENTLTGLAGEAEARLRFVFSSNGGGNLEGVGIDNFTIYQPASADLAAARLSNTPGLDCGSFTDEVIIRIYNAGTQPQSGFEVGYSVNGGPAITETVPNTIQPGNQLGYSFNATFDSSVPGTYVITAWTALAGDALTANDTITYVYQTAFESPFREDFEAGVVPGNFTILSPNVLVGNGHNNISNVIYSNLYDSNPEMAFNGPVVGPIAADDTLSFDYRYVDYFAGTSPTFLGAGDSLEVLLSLDCGENFFPAFTINSNNHTPAVGLTNVEIPLADYAGAFVQVQFRASWSDGDYWLDIDNITVRSCPESLELDAEVVKVSSQGAADGVITVEAGAGSGPYTYNWSTGAISPSLSGLEPGTYKVTVTDAFGCQDQLSVALTVISSIEAPQHIRELTLAPNPTRGASTLNVSFARPVDARIQLFSAMGQLLFETAEKNITRGTYELDLSRFGSGLYLVRIVADGEARTAKLIRAD